MNKNNNSLLAKVTKTQLIIGTISLVVLITIIYLVIASGNVKNNIVGTWKVSPDTDSSSYFEFDKKGEFYLYDSYGSEQAEGTYTVNSKNIKINADNLESSTIRGKASEGENTGNMKLVRSKLP
ncbi:hypothetical protein ACVPPR_03635 [Dellaglioa sp. L3N]